MVELYHQKPLSGVVFVKRKQVRYNFLRFSDKEFSQMPKVNSLGEYPHITQNQFFYISVPLYISSIMLLVYNKTSRSNLRIWLNNT